MDFTRFMYPLTNCIRVGQELKEHLCQRISQERKLDFESIYRFPSDIDSRKNTMGIQDIVEPNSFLEPIINISDIKSTNNRP